MLHALRRSNLQHCIDLEETGSICCHCLRVFVTVSLFFFFLRAGWGTSRKRRPFMPRKASDNGYAGFWCVLLLWRSFALNRINKCFFSDHRIKCNRGGSRPSERSPVLPSDLVLIHNHIMEALAKPDNEINEDYDFWNAAPKLKTPYLKFCNAHNNRLRNVLAEYRIICEDETQTTTASVKGMILNWKSRTPMSRQ